ncbi:zinc finger protein [Macleaya cordata]|uniref:Zinc finger protein n=1 Tax=Macleaya cordata TaxID=56857 RepID=A0A200QTH0_MACCD|nr:zinc finger protein [Macleaya cordata]
MEVEKKSENIGRLFSCCTKNCGFFKWSDSSHHEESESSGAISDESVTEGAMDDLSRIFKNLARISEKEDVEISFQVTIRKGKGKADEK